MKNTLASAFTGLLPAGLLLLLFLPADALRGDIKPSNVKERGSREGDATKEDGEKELKPTLDREGGEDYLRQVVKEGEENLKEINKLLDEVQKNLASKETGSPTQEKQKNVVERMNKLLENLEQCCRSSGGKSGNQQTSMDQKQQKADEEQKKKEQEKLRQGQKLQAQQPKPQGEKERNDAKVDNDRKADETPPEAKAGSLRDVILEGARRWGLLPPKLRDEVLFSPGKEAPREYIEIISKYYQRMSEFYRQSTGR